MANNFKVQNKEKSCENTELAEEWKEQYLAMNDRTRKDVKNVKVEAKECSKSIIIIGNITWQTLSIHQNTLHNHTLACNVIFS